MVYGLEINLKILIPVVVAILVIVVAVAILTLPRDRGETMPTTQEQSQTTETTQTEQQTETTRLGLIIGGIGIGYRDYINPYDGEMISRGIRGFIELNISLEGYGTLKKIILDLKDYGNITITDNFPVSSPTRMIKSYKIELRMNETSSRILETLKQSKLRVYVFYEEDGKEYTTTKTVVPSDLSIRETSPYGRP